MSNHTTINRKEPSGYRHTAALRSCALLLAMALLPSFQGVSVPVEEFRQEMKGIQQTLDGLAFYEVDASYKIYNQSTGKMFESVIGRYVKKGRSHYNRIAFVEQVRSDKYELVIDNAHRFVVIDTVTKFTGAENITMLASMDTMDFSKVVAIKAYQSSAEVKGYELQFAKKGAAMSKLLFEYNGKSQLPARIVMYLNRKIPGKTQDEVITPRVEMEFTHYSTKDEGAGRLTDPGHFVQQKNGKWAIVNEQYKGYSIKKSY